jgi:hypothetical protein
MPDEVTPAGLGNLHLLLGRDAILDTSDIVRLAFILARHICFDV